MVDVSENSVIVELAGKTSRVEAFLKLVQPFGVLESARTGAMPFLSLLFLYTHQPFLLGLMVMPRTPINVETEETEGQGSDAVDATLLPPG